MFFFDCYLNFFFIFRITLWKVVVRIAISKALISLLIIKSSKTIIPTSHMILTITNLLKAKVS